MKHDEYHRQFAEGIIEQIRQGTAPWQKPWGPGGSACSPRTSIPDAPTREATACTLPPSSRSAATATCAGAPTARSKPGTDRCSKGEQWHSHPLVPGPPEDRRQRRARTAQVRDNEGKRVYRHERLPRRPSSASTTVFNAEQADGLPARPAPAAEPLWKAHQQAERVLEDGGVPVRHVAGDRAFYNLNRDEIVLPERGQFPSANHYYQTALHELGHSTGHPGAHEPRDAHPRDL